MGTRDSMERNTNYVLSAIHNSRATLIDKIKFIAVAATEMITSERTIRDLIVKLERAGKIDVRIWK